MRLDAIARRALVANAAATTAHCYSKEIYPVAKEPTRVRVGPPRHGLRVSFGASRQYGFTVDFAPA